ncbi:sulfate adenylyltransferase subunit CysD [Kitasatospora sp. NPDC049258]|uniref:sulfate adenylyltransferase subunit CysD n=1 Tax=Kitasatospora sp. NPDC049258 TaxID=3155394 RepID=UPI0034307093
MTTLAEPARRTAGAPPAPDGHLNDLRDEAIHVLREVAGQFDRPALLFSGGKDSVLVLHLALLAFRPAPVPFPLLHVDTGHNFPEVLAFRDATAERAGARLLVARVQDSIDAGRVRERPDGLRNPLQTVTLLDAVAEHRFDALIGGARRDEDRARAKERIFSLRDEFGQWDPRRQRPELWQLYNGRHLPGEHLRVFPLSNWTELDVWRYLAREDVPLPELYRAHRRRVLRRDGMWLPESPHVPLRAGERIEERLVRYRTVGDVTCTGAVESSAVDYPAIVTEVALSRTTERGATRADDRVGQAAMEDRKREGYF